MTATHVLRLVEREVRVYRRLWMGLVFSSIVQPVLYLSAMGIGLGGYVDDRTPGALAGVPYLDFVAPGLLAASVFQFGVADSLWWVMSGSRWDRRYHAMVASPIDATDVMAGHVVWVTLRMTVSATWFVAVAALLGAVASPWAVLAIPSAALLTASMAALVSAWSTTAETDNSFSVLMRLGVLPLFLFSGTFFPTSQLPGWLRPVAPISPLYHGVELCRAAMTGHASGAGAVVTHVLVLLGFLVVGIVVGRRTFSRRLEP